MILLAIESSCDETSVAIFKDGQLIKNVINSQIETFKDYGGVVPELASRLHETNFPVVINELFKDIEIEIDDITHVAYTHNPGLNGALMVGRNVAQTIALFLDVPLIPIDHMHGHMVSPNLTNDVVYPALALVVSGGHTQLVEMKSSTEYYVLGETLDDAVGETYDKVARVLKLDYPGGPKVDKAAQIGEANIKFTLPMNDDSLNFSYSGLKSQVINHVNRLRMKNEKVVVEDIAASFQNVAIDILIRKTKVAWTNGEYKTLVVAGGVSANSEVRKRVSEVTDNVALPELKYCGDNAAMIGMAAIEMINSETK